jgi:hypothetical protein
MLASLGLRLRQHCQFLTLASFVKKTFFFEKELMKKKEPATMPNHKLSKSVCLQTNSFRTSVKHDATNNLTVLIYVIIIIIIIPLSYHIL